MNLRYEAQALVKQWAWLQQDTVLVEDVEMAGWEALCAQRDPLPAMRNEITRWLWGVTRGQLSRKLTYAVALEQAGGLRSTEAPPDRAAEARVNLERLWHSAPIDERLVWVWLVKYGPMVPRAVYHQVGWNSNIFHDRREALKQRAARMLSHVPAGRKLHFRRRRPRCPLLLGSSARPAGNSA